MDDDTIIDIGDAVVCDFCNADYTEPPASEAEGGVLIGSYAVCPRCAPEAIQNAEKYDEPIDARCPPGKRFKQWVLELRGGDNTIRISAAVTQDVCARCGTELKDGYESLCYTCQMQAAEEEDEQ